MPTIEERKAVSGFGSVKPSNIQAIAANQENSGKAQVHKLVDAFNQTHSELNKLHAISAKTDKPSMDIETLRQKTMEVFKNADANDPMAILFQIEKLLRDYEEDKAKQLAKLRASQGKAELQQLDVFVKKSLDAADERFTGACISAGGDFLHSLGGNLSSRMQFGDGATFGRYFKGSVISSGLGSVLKGLGAYFDKQAAYATTASQTAEKFSSTAGQEKSTTAQNFDKNMDEYQKLLDELAQMFIKIVEVPVQ